MPRTSSWTCGARASTPRCAPAAGAGAGCTPSRWRARRWAWWRRRSAPQQLAAEPLLGDAGSWARWLALSGARLAAKPVAEFNDFGLMLQATEQDLGIALTRELLAADALRAGRLVRLHEAALDEPASSTYWFAHPEELAGWPPLQALRAWLNDEMALSRRALAASAAA